jgi:hypothetical protein
MREDVDKVAADLLDLEEVWSAEELRRIETLAYSLIEEARFLGVEPREHAAGRLVSWRQVSRKIRR